MLAAVIEASCPWRKPAPWPSPDDKKRRACRGNKVDLAARLDSMRRLQPRYVVEVNVEPVTVRSDLIHPTLFCSLPSSTLLLCPTAVSLYDAAHMTPMDGHPRARTCMAADSRRHVQVGMAGALSQDAVDRPNALTVFCGSALGKSVEFSDAARQVGSALAASGITLV